MNSDFIFTNSDKDFPQQFINIIKKEKYIRLLQSNKKNSKIIFKNTKNTLIIIVGSIVRYQKKKVNNEEILKIILKEKKYEECLKECEGNFNLIVYSKKTKEVFFARDIEGLLPLYFRKNKNKFFISNTPKYIKFDSKLDTNFCKKYIFLRYNFVYGGMNTFIKDVKFVEAATYFKINKNKFIKKRYWDEALNNESKYINYKNAKIKTLQILKQRFKVFNIKNSILALSGGLDSGSVAAIFKLIQSPLKSFTAYYDSKKIINESSQAKKIADLCCLSWKRISISSQEFFNAWKTCYRDFTYPVCTSSFIGYLILYKKVKKINYKKIINAGNGDHFFLGNFTVFKYFLADLFFTNDKDFNNELKNWIKNFSTKEFPKSSKIFFDFLKKSELKKQKNYYLLKVNSEITGSNYLKRKIPKKTIIMKGSSFVDAYCKHSLWYSERQPGLLAFSEIEKISKIKSIDPFDDIELRNFFYGLSDKYKIKNGYGKRIIRDILKSVLPKSIINNKSKIGFNVPFSEWMFNNNNMHNFILGKLENFFDKEIIKFIKLDKLIKDFKSKNKKLQNTENSMFIWQLVNFIMWRNYNFNENNK